MITFIDWQPIIAESQRIKEFSYSPYSHYTVGAAGLLRNGKIVSGTNVESASYGLTLCAECSMTSQNIGAGRSTFVAISIVGPQNTPTVPCGRCRQVMAEHSDEETLLMTPDGPKLLIKDFLPYPLNY